MEVTSLALALHYLSLQHYLRQVFRVKSPDGVILDEDYESPTKIPPTVEDRFYSGRIDTSEAEIVTGYVVEGGDAKR